MSNDLISRKALLNRFEYSEADNETDKAWICTVRRIIKEQPTAFDKEKVIESLKNKVEDSRKYWNEFDNEVAFGEMNAYTTAIKIVKKGGIK